MKHISHATVCALLVFVPGVIGFLMIPALRRGSLGPPGLLGRLDALILLTSLFVVHLLLQLPVLLAIARLAHAPSRRVLLSGAGGVCSMLLLMLLLSASRVEEDLPVLMAIQWAFSHPVEGLPLLTWVLGGITFGWSVSPLMRREWTLRQL